MAVGGAIKRRLMPMFSGLVLRATVPPLASIFGSGFLIIIPVLERTLGSLSIAGIAGVCGFAWLIGTAIRHNVAAVEPLAERGQVDRTTGWLEQASDLAIAAAYVISVALYLRIMSQYVVEFAISGSDLAERTLAAGAVLLITVVGVLRGFSGLDLMERLALGAVLVLTTVVGGALFVADGADLLGGGLQLPPVPGRSLVDVLLILGGTVIAVQGFETVRYLTEEYDRPTRIWASRLSQLVSASIYIGFVAVATPMMGSVADGGYDATLLDITERLLPVLSVAVVITAILSQFSAATADTVAAHGNIDRYLRGPLGGPLPYLVSGVAAMLLVWLVPTFTLIVVASRAFAAYYALQCVVAARTSEGVPRKLGFGLLALILAAITLLAQPAG